MKSSTALPIPLLRRHREQILELAERHGASNIRLFGSVARGDWTPESDIDLLVTLEPGRDYLDLVGLWQDLEALLGCRVDVLSDGGVSPYLKERIHSEAIQF